MKYLTLALVFAAGFAAAHAVGLGTAADQQPNRPAPKGPPTNPNIDIAAHLTNAQAAAKHRESRRLSEDEFLRASQEEGVIVLDARSKEMYDLMHVKGAINLSFPNIDVESLKKVLPNKDAKILIYCNNNFTPVTGVPAAQQAANPTAAQAAKAFRPKSAGASLNLSTFAALYGYGYTNVYELAPTLDPTKTKLALVSNTK